jgi:hypothetical protein
MLGAINLVFWKLIVNIYFCEICLLFLKMQESFLNFGDELNKRIVSTAIYQDYLRLN